MPTILPGTPAFHTRQYYYPAGNTGQPIDAELTWEQLDSTLLSLSSSISSIIVPSSITKVVVGTSASLVLSSSGAVTASISEGTVWVVANDTAQNNGLSYIFDAGPGPGAWYPLQLNIPLPYVRLAATSSAAQIITSSLIMSGSGVTFSSSLYWSGSSQALANSTNYTVILSSSGQLYVTGAYGGGGGSTPSTLGFKTDPNASYQLISTDNNKVVRLLNSSTITVQVTASNITSGDQVIVMQSGSGQCVFTAGPGTTIFSANNMLKTRTQYRAATLIFSGSAHCYLFGDIAP